MLKPRLKQPVGIRLLQPQREGGWSGWNRRGIQTGGLTFPLKFIVLDFIHFIYVPTETFKIEETFLKLYNFKTEIPESHLCFCNVLVFCFLCSLQLRQFESVDTF